ncbi:hypothetical protein [Haloarchaeobius sp. HRN-SO-5]|uniref:hypothetical protein n=1 Tax=Haloarchaeobius sp. HRN-SO-5 TaxID=3446118 RepID=UPI003EBC7A66
MTVATVSRWARRYVLVAATFAVLWQIGVVAGVPRRAEVVLGLYGFVLLTVFGKAYSLVPTYFDRRLAWSNAPVVQFPLVVAGVVGLAGAALRPGQAWLGTAGAVLWTLGVAVFLGTLAWTVRTNPTGRETATGEANAQRRPVDRVANGFVPVALLYLLAGTYETLAMHTGLPPMFDGYPPRTTHLLAAGTASLLVFALGFRLLPRFLVARPVGALVAPVLLAGALGPVTIAASLWSPPWFHVGALLEAIAVFGFAVSYVVLFVRSDRRRVGFYGVLLGAASGVAGVTLGLWFAVAGSTAGLPTSHLRLNLLGFLGLTILGVGYQFYPPAVGVYRGASDRTAYLSLGCLGGGLALQVVGLLAPAQVALVLGRWLALAGALLYAFVLLAVFAAR